MDEAQHVWQTRTGDDVATVVWTGNAAGLAVGDDDGTTAVQLDLDQLRELAEWLNQLLAAQ